MTAKHRRSHVFISYNHNDAKWVKRLRIHLEPLKKQYGIVVWDYQEIRPGAIWQEETKTAIDAARVAILLVSADFIASDFITNNELPALLQAAETEGTIILPVIVSPSSFSQTSLAKFQTVNDPTEPLTALSKTDQETVFQKVSSAVEHSFSESSTADQNLRPLDSKVRLILIGVIFAMCLAWIVIKLVATYGGQTPSVTATAQARSELSGIVVDNNEKPLQGARVTLDDLPAMAPVETSSDGVFSLRDIPRQYGDSVRVRVVMEGYRPNPHTEDVILGKAPPRITLTKVK
jgi:TIR domain-containing protein/carboxypeptidase family protein